MTSITDTAATAVGTSVGVTIANRYVTPTVNKAFDMSEKAAIETARRVDRYNVEHNPIEKGRDDKPLRRTEDTPASPIEGALIGGGLLVSAAGAPVVGLAAVTAGSALKISRVDKNKPEDERFCPIM